MSTVILLILILALAAAVGYGYNCRTRAHTRDQLVVLQAQIARMSRALAHQQQATQVYQGRIAALINNAYDVLLVIDDSRRILEANRNARKLFKTDSLTGQRLDDIVAVPELIMLIDNVVMHNTDVVEEQIIIGEQYYNVKACATQEGGAPLIDLALRDVTRLVKLNRARRDMVANISHELRTPIANIRLIIEGLFHEQERPKRKDSISSLHAIARETESLLWLVQEMSDLSMIESGQAIVRMVDVPLQELVGESIERLEDQLDAKHVKLKQQIVEPFTVLCDRDLARRVLVNLVHNAMKWSPPGGTITVKAEASDEEVVISVLDNGPGVSEDQVDRIFERFYQTDSSRSGAAGGTGLGLAICRHIVEAHGGRIWAESGKEGGGRFMFTLLNAKDSP